MGIPVSGYSASNSVERETFCRRLAKVDSPSPSNEGWLSSLAGRTATAGRVGSSICPRHKSANYDRHLLAGLRNEFSLLHLIDHEGRLSNA